MKNYTAIFTTIILGLMFLAAAGQVKAAPSNDNIADAKLLFLQDGTATGTNIGATLEAGEPNHHDSYVPGIKTVWYKWTALSSFSAKFELADDYQSTIAVYSAASANPGFAQLTAKAANSDHSINEGANNRVKFFAEAGKTYYIAIGGYVLFSSITEGNFQLKYGRNHFRYSTDLDTHDDKASLSVFRPSDGVWYNLNNSTSAGVNIVPWGMNGDTPVAADYDGNGSTDFAVARNAGSFKNWYIETPSVQPGYQFYQWGLASDRAIVGEFDGDGRADIGVIRNQADGSYWYIRQSNNGMMRSFFFGVNGDKPVLGDFDGDGLTDVTVTRSTPSGVYWYILKSSTNYNQYSAVQFGMQSDVMAAEDYDGDGKTDIAVFRPSNGYWYITRSSDNQFQAEQFGQAGDKPQPADYDADGKADTAVYRPSNGTWYIMRSGNNQFYAKQWGIASDIPTSSLTSLTQ